MKLRALMLLGLCCAVPAQAGLFSDDDARKQIQEVGARVLQLEDQSRQQTKSIFDLQGQIDALNNEIRKLLGQNEELAHGLQDAEKREKDFYVDLDTRLRRLEPTEGAVVSTTQGGAPAAVDSDDPTTENRAIEAAYGQSKAGNHVDAAKAYQTFLHNYPDSVHAANARYWLGNAQFALHDYKPALATYRALLKAEPNTPKAPEVMLNIAGCQQELKALAASTATLKQLIAKYPDSAAAAKAQQLLAVVK
ncbi:MAG: tol-pal system protein YbgF [Gallionellaceae bacterium CG1_02_56_997]|nr:MAG: tol-pal system protein YbgF [Gallionellaceae bacterium CG1_02_56_997]